MLSKMAASPNRARELARARSIIDDHRSPLVLEIFQAFPDKWAAMGSNGNSWINAQAVESIDGMSLNETEFRYPLPLEEISRIKASYESDVAAAKNEMRPVFATCLEECNSTPTKCYNHKPQYVKILRALYTGGSWVLYRPANFVAAIHKMFDENVDPKYIAERVAREQRSHNKDSVCTFSVDDEGAVRQLKLDARAMYDNDEIPEEVILDFMREELIRLKSTLEQASLREIYETLPDDPKLEEARKAQRAHVIKQLLDTKSSGTCAGCLKNAVPEHPTRAIFRCRVCKVLVERGLQGNESYYCSKNCVRDYGERHMLEKHPCTAGVDCINRDRHAFETFTKYCPECWDEWGKVSYICKMPCYDKNWLNHWTKTHLRLEKEFNERMARERSIVELGEESERSAEGEGMQVVSTSDSDAETLRDYDMTDA